MKLKELIEQLPDDTKERVEKACKRYNQVIRESMRNVTRLRLQKGKRKFLHSNEQIETRVPVQVRTAAPEYVEKLEIPQSGIVAAVLSEWRPQLGMLQKSASDLMMLLANGIGIPAIDEELFKRNDIKEREISVWGAEELAKLLLSEIDKFDVVGWLLHEVQEDVLGCYSYPNAALGIEECAPKIELFWGVMGLVSPRLDVELEDLTAVVLSHELAHAYTHLGFDVDNYRWSDSGFADSQHELKEGLAQYYGRLALEHLTEVLPNALNTYEKLLAIQPLAYQMQREWVEMVTPEAVRYALVTLRREGAIGFDMFQEHIRRATKERYLRI